MDSIIIKGVILIFFSCVLVACSTTLQDEKWEVSNQLDYEVKTKEHTNITFVNSVQETADFNYFSFSYIYAGAGVAIGDINNDELPDIFFIGNDVKNRLYLNEGSLSFKDISQLAGIGGKEKLRWATGVTMADVNDDGWLDIYVCISGPSPDKQNLLYINNQDLTFTESARQFGINDRGYSNQASFFDYDNDGDLDLFIIAYPPADFQSPNSFYVDKMANPDEVETDRLYENTGDGNFEDITEQAGLKNYGLSLNASISDFNNDGWYDIYISNDFNAPDYLYINEKNGTFKNQIHDQLKHTSNFGMGSDAADFDNDGDQDLMQLDMMGSNNIQRKKNMSAMNPEIFYETVELGLQHQYMRNCLQLNNGNGSFSDIAEYAGVANTDWSWSTLFADMNNDGWQDIFITNGMRRSVNNKDFQVLVQRLVKDGKINDRNRHQLLDYMPVEPTYNTTYLNQGNLKMQAVVDLNGLSYRGFTHGAAYGDLDLDGDLDFVVNNLDKLSMVVENKIEEQGYLRIKFQGDKANKFGIGAKATIINNGQLQTRELIPSRGYLSSVEPILHFGVGQISQIDSIIIKWPSGNIQVKTNVKTNQTITFKESKSKARLGNDAKHYSYFKEQEINIKPHIENAFDDFQHQVLLPHKLSRLGPALAIGDINNDGLDDLYTGGAHGQTGVLYIQNKDGVLEMIELSVFEPDKIYEDVDALFFDLDSDGDLDLYVVSGGNEWPAQSTLYEDRLYINDGKGNFSKNATLLPKLFDSGSKVKPYDFDGDGDLDLFVGTRHSPHDYPAQASSRLLKNENGTLIDITNSFPELKEIGMVTDASWADIDQNGEIDLIVVGEWLRITAFCQIDGTFVNKTEALGLSQTVGWWNTIESTDLDGDGDLDFVVGNLGLNSKYKTSIKEPFQLYYSDMDNSGTDDIVLGYYENGSLYPVRGRECSSQQVPALKSKFVSYDAFSKASLQDVYDLSSAKNGLHYMAHTFSSIMLENMGENGFQIHELPSLAQFSCINSIIIQDFTNDNQLDILIAGNNFDTEVETPRNDASIGLLLKGNDWNTFDVKPIEQSGLLLNGNVKNIKMLNGSQQQFLVVANNNDDWQFFSVNSDEK